VIGIIAVFLVVALIGEAMRDSKLRAVGCGCLTLLGAGLVGVVILVGMLIDAPKTRAHDHKRPDLDSWYPTLLSGKGPCCDGPKNDALHLRDVDWETQNKAMDDGEHYRVRVPKNALDFKRAVEGQDVDTQWVDVPDNALVTEPNKDVGTLVWPIYGYLSPSIRCFLPGTLS
jgi:hypothetical protein